MATPTFRVCYLPVKSKFEMRTHTVRPYGVSGYFVVKM